MNEITVQFKTKNQPIDPEFLKRLESVADEFGVSVDIDANRSTELEQQNRGRDIDEFIRKADDLARRIGPQTIDSTDLIREDRDRL